MKYSIAFLAFIFIHLTGFSQQITYSQFKEEAKTNIRLTPRYGNVPKQRNKKRQMQN